MLNFNKNLISDCLREADSVNDDLVSCQGFELRVNNLMDQRVSLSSDRSLQEHAEDCLTCGQVLQQYQQLELLLGGQRDAAKTTDKVCLSDDRVEVAGPVGSPFEKNTETAFSWEISPLVIIATLVVLMVGGQYFNDAASVEVAPKVAITETSQVPTTDHLAASLMSDETSLTSDQADMVLPWRPEFPMEQLMGLVDSGSELLAAGEEKVSVIRELPGVRFDLGGLESQLESLQPVLSFSGRIPALSPLQGTVCFTLGWLKQGRVDSQQDSDAPTTEVGMQRLLLKNLV